MEIEQPPKAIYEERQGSVAVRFYGKGLVRNPVAALTPLLPAEIELAWVDQIHSAEVLVAKGGCAGRGDALTTREPGLALTVVTADCVPVLMASEDGEIAAVHAGWRGIAARIIPAAIRRMESVPLVAWIGPCIGEAAYEVGPEVAGQVVEVSEPSVRTEVPGANPRLDLGLAAQCQLRAAGVADIRRVGLCTHSDPRLWSYRQDGTEAGRNFSVIWRTP